MTNQPFHAIILAAGSGIRFNQESTTSLPKQYLPLAGKPVLRHSIEKFLGAKGLKSLQVVISPEHAKTYHDTVIGLDLPHPIAGGDSRKYSIVNALKDISHIKDDEIVVIHDAARPNLSSVDIESLLAVMGDYDAASLVLPVTDTLRKGSVSQSEIVDREGLWTLQTPQAFRYGILKKAHKQMIDKDFTDDTGLISAAGGTVKLVPGSKENIKVTTPADLEILEKLMTHNGQYIQETRTGLGFDVHAFSNNENRKLILCGIEVDHPFGLEGHSDADVGLHALTDAILGAIGEGDIGQHFPPSDDNFKNMDSRVFLAHAASLLRQKGGRLQNADLTIICEKPKIGPYRPLMQAKIAEILGVDPARINVKATTTERLGFTGREEGIAAQAIVSVLIGLK